MRNPLFLLIFLVSFSICGQESAGVIEVNGYASIEVEPDYLDLQLVIETKGDDVSEVQGELMDRSKKILAYLSERKGVARVKTDRVSLSPRYDYQTDKTSFFARQNISFRITIIEEYDALIPGLLELGVNGIGNSSFGSTEVELLKAKLLNQALLNAQEKALQMASTLGQEVGKAIFISDQLNGGSPSPYGRSMDLKFSSAEPSIEGGKMEVSQQVRVRFQLK